MCFGALIYLTKAAKISPPQGLWNPSEQRFFTGSEEVSVPIIERCAHDPDMRTPMFQAMKRNPRASAVIVRNQGIYVWGDSWQQCKAT